MKNPPPFPKPPPFLRPPAAEPAAAKDPPTDQADAQRQRILSAGHENRPEAKPVDVISLLAGIFRVGIFLVLLVVSLAMTLSFPPVGLVMLFLLALVMLTAK
jgi:hypothetical protein